MDRGTGCDGRMNELRVPRGVGARPVRRRDRVDFVHRGPVMYSVSLCMSIGCIHGVALNGRRRGVAPGGAGAPRLPERGGVGVVGGWTVWTILAGLLAVAPGFVVGCLGRNIPLFAGVASPVFVVLCAHIVGGGFGRRWGFGVLF